MLDSAYVDVTNNRDQNRFELRLSGDLVGIIGYFEMGDTPVQGCPVISFMHTVIVEDFGHRGLAAVLVSRALELAREYQWKVKPVCTYVQRFLADNQGYRDVVVPTRGGAGAR